MATEECLCRGGNQLAHRVSYKLFVKEVLEDLDILHRCDTPCCVNPVHLLIGTHTDNMIDSAIKGRKDRKLTRDQVILIRESSKSLGELALEFGICKPHVCGIKLGKKRNHVKAGL